jgi:simple sugar transport system ATP-binding protein
MGRADQPVSATAVEAHGVSRRFGPTLALSDVSIQIPAGETRGLIGRNGAGKSTLVGLMTGLLEPSEGRIDLWGRPAPKPSDRTAWRRLVGTVHQHSTLQRDLSVAENLFLGGLPTRSAGLVSWSGIRSRARAILEEWELDIPETRPARALTLAQRQVVEIARELSRGARFVILDEPTSRLASGEIDQLYGHIRRLKSDGVTVVYISHHLNEVMELCDAVTVLKDGRHVVTRQVADTTAEQLVADMVGDVTDPVIAPAGAATAGAAEGDVAMSVEDLRAPGLEPLSFQLRAGETLGVAGLVGSGKEVLAELLAGEVAPDRGSITVGHHTLSAHTVAEAIEAGIAAVPADRHGSGQVAGLGIGENVTMTIARRIAGPLGFISPRRRREVAAGLMRDVGVVAASPRQPASSLSGGNQQKGVVARALASNPRVLVLVNPTTGVDIASKATIVDVIVRHREAGMAVLLVSDELEEYQLCDRVLVLFGGRMVREMDGGFALEDLLSAIEGVGEER